LVLDDVLGFQIGRDESSPIATLIILAHFIPFLAIQARKLHDIDKSGWWILIGPIPLGALVISCTPSSKGPNRFDSAADSQTAVVPQTPAATNGMSSSATVEHLQKLATLKASGALDDEKFLKLKSEVMNQTI
jgi:hypothetical protein